MTKDTYDELKVKLNRYDKISGEIKKLEACKEALQNRRGDLMVKIQDCSLGRINDLLCDPGVVDKGDQTVIVQAAFAVVESRIYRLKEERNNL